MKTVIISDIKSKSESIIPFGLNLAKFLESTVEIIHTVDSRVEQGIPSRHADSQSITPGNKMPHAQILEREKKQAGDALDKLLSYEVSRLNYPLKVETRIREASIESLLNLEAGISSSTLIVVSSEADGQVFISQDEILQIAQGLDALTLIVPPGETFEPFKNILMVTDFSIKSPEKLKHIFSFLEKFSPLLNAVNVAKKSDYATLELQSKEWSEEVKNIFTRIKPYCNILTGENYLNALIDYTGKKHPDLTLVCKNSLFDMKGLFRKKPDKRLVEKKDFPVLIY